VSFPLAAIGLKMEQQDQAALQSLSTREDVLAYVQSYHLDSYWVCLIVVVLAGFAYLGLVEGVGLLIRAFAGRKTSNSDLS
jgi:hypothetical protein